MGGRIGQKNNFLKREKKLMDIDYSVIIMGAGSG